MALVEEDKSFVEVIGDSTRVSKGSMFKHYQQLQEDHGSKSASAPVHLLSNMKGPHAGSHHKGGAAGRSVMFEDGPGEESAIAQLLSVGLNLAADTVVTSTSRFVVIFTSVI